MKTNNIIRILIFTFCLIVVLSCNENKKSNEIINNQVNDSIKKEISTKLIENPNKNNSILLDTLLNGFLIRIEKISRNSEGKDSIRKNMVLDDNEFKLIIKNKNKDVLNKIFKKEFFSNIIPYDEMKFYHFSVFIFDRIDKENLLFFINICKPDTDICYPIQMTIDKNGNIETLELDDELDE